MTSFSEFSLICSDTIYGGDLLPTYIGENGDFYDTENERFVIILLG